MPNVIFCDSFDHYGSNDFGRKWHATGGTFTISTGNGRNSTNCVRFTQSSQVQYLHYNFNSYLNELYVELAVKSTVTGGNFPLITVYDFGTPQINLNATSGGDLYVMRGTYNGGTYIGGSVTQPIAALNTWYHIGFYIKIGSGTSGAYDIRVNGVSVNSNSATNTQATGAAQMTGVRIGSYNTTTTTDIDDLVLSTDGFCGDVRIKAVFPDSAGTYGAWTANPYMLVNRTSSVTVTTGSLAVFSGTLNQVVDGTLTAGISISGWTLTSNAWLKFDFGVGNAPVITEAQAYFNDSSSHGVWKWQGSNDDSSYTDIGSSFTLGSATAQTHTALNGNATGYRYYKLQAVSGTSTASKTLYEIEFYIPAEFATQYFQAVGHSTYDGDQTYLYTNVAGRSSYGFAAVGVTGNVKAVQHVSMVRKDDSGSRRMQQFVRLYGTNYDTSDIVIYDDYRAACNVLVNNPASGTGWNTSDINLAEFGTEFVS